MLINHLILAWRNLLRHKAFSIVNIAGLSVSITCCLVISIFVRYELSFDRYHEKAGNIYKVVEKIKFGDEERYWNTTAYPLAEALRNDFTELPLVAQVSGPTNRLFAVEGKSGTMNRYEEGYVLFVDPYFPKVFDLIWLYGDKTTALNDRYSVVITEGTARKYFGDATPEVIGRRIFLNNKDMLTVTGVIQDAPANTSVRYDVLVPYAFFKENNPYYSSNWSGNYQGSTFITLPAEASPEQLTSQINDWKKKYLKPEDDHRIQYMLQPLSAVHTDTLFGSGPKSYVMPVKMLYAGIGIGFFILIIACVNFINLTTAQAANRAKEVGIRKVMGSTKAALVTQFLYENILVIALSVILSLAFTQLALTGVNQALTLIDLHLKIDLVSIFSVLLLGVLVILLACFYPAFVMASFKPAEALRARFNARDTGGLSLRRLLIVFQFAIVQLFIIGTVVIAAQMNYLKHKDLGFYSETVLMNSLPTTEKAMTFRERLLTNRSIADVTLSSGSPVSQYGFRYGTSFRLPSQPEEAGKQAELKGVDLSYVGFYELQLLAGKNFTRAEERFTEFLVNEKLVYAMGWTPEQAVGQRLMINEGEATIVGVVKDFHNNSLQDEITPCVITPWKDFYTTASIRFQSGIDIQETMAFVEKMWKESYPEWVYSYSFLDDNLALNYEIQELIFKGFKIFGLLTVCIGCLGLYGLLSFMTIRKTKEVGIRKVLGASIINIVLLFSKEFTLLVLISFVVAAPIAYFFMNQWLQDFTYHVDLSWWMFLLGVLFTVIITLFTIGYQSIHAALANPVDSLRDE